MPSHVTAPVLNPKEAYRLWSKSYDTEKNPLLCLEERFLGWLLPRVDGLDVVDVGCGTGRWLKKLSRQNPRSLTGIDFSSEMLEQAHAGIIQNIKLVEADCGNLDLASDSTDLLLCCFLLSYIKDIETFACNVARMLREGGSIFITDVHPKTAAELNWRRGCKAGEDFCEVSTENRTLGEIAAVFESNGLRACVLLEPQFGDVERKVFEAADKREAFDRAAGFPGIFILQLTKSNVPLPQEQTYIPSDLVGAVTGGNVAIGPHEAVHADLSFREERIASLASSKSQKHCDGRPEIDLDGFLLMPGLINAHDHLEFALFPRLGNRKYKNFKEWADEIYQPESSPLREHRAVPKAVRLWWGGIRNLLCGVTTICHHNPYDADVFEKQFPVRILREFSWAHSLTMDVDVFEKKQKSRKGEPFILHLGEGVDASSRAEIFHLAEAGALDRETVLVHGLALDDAGKILLQFSRAGLIWCPSSNVFLFEKTLSREDIASFQNVALGSDSPITACGDLLDEIRFAHQHTGIDPHILYSLVASKPARLLRLKRGESTLCPSAYADFIAVLDRQLSPAETLAGLSYRDVELVVLGGRVQLASPELKERLPCNLAIGLEPLAIENEIRWIRAPLDYLFAETEKHLGQEIYLGGKPVRRGN